MGKNKNFDFNKADRYKLTPERLDSYCHIIFEELGNPEPITKADVEDIILNGDINLSSFQVRKNLNPKIWVNGRMNSKVRLRLLDIADDFVKTFETDWAKPKDIILTGSLANYNWSKYSDFDLHILMDFSEVDERTNFVKDYFDSKKNLWNEKHENLKIYGFPVEVYVQDINEAHSASGIYSLEKDKWLKTPERNELKAAKMDEPMIKDKTGKFIKAIESLEDESMKEVGEYEADKLSMKTKALFDKIKGIRRESLKNGNEMSAGNIMFKILRRAGYIERLMDIKARTYDKRYSIK